MSDFGRILYNHDDILKVMPHRQPMLLVDRVYKDDEGVMTGIKNISFSVLKAGD